MKYAFENGPLFSYETRLNYNQDEKIECYSCSYAKQSNGEIVGNENCVNVDDTTDRVGKYFAVYRMGHT